MDLYSSSERSQKVRWFKKVEVFFRSLFLLASSVFAALIGIFLIDKSNTIANATGWVALPLFIIWFVSFVLWIIFMIANSKVIKAIFLTESNKLQKKIGLAIFVIWIFSLIGTIYTISRNLYSTIIVINFFATLILLPIWIFLIANKIIKVITGVLIGLLLIYFVIYLFVMRPHKLNGISMEPNFVNGEYALSNIVGYNINSPSRGDVVVFKPPPIVSNGEFYARIIGLPNETIMIKNSHVYIDGKLLVEPYLANGTKTQEGPFLTNSPVLIPQGEYFILGDNRDHSNDSRYYGFVDSKSIEGKVFYIYWPQNLSGLVKYAMPYLVDNGDAKSNKFVSTSQTSCHTLGTQMITGTDGSGQIGCDIYVSGNFDLSKSYCESGNTHRVEYLMPDTFGKQNQYYATLTALSFNEPVHVYIYDVSGKQIECLPILNK